MTLSNNAQIQARARETTEAVLTLVTISPVGFSIVRLVNNTIDITSRGNVYTALPLTIQYSPDDGESLKEYQLILDNIDLDLITWVRSITTPIPVVIETVFSGDLDTVEQSVSSLSIRKVVYTSTSIKASLTVNDDLNQKIPSDSYDPLKFKGLFQ